MIAISTESLSEGNIFTAFCNCDIFKKIVVSLVCADCFALGEKREVCPHNRDQVPDWLMEDGSKIIKALGCDNEAYERETLGLKFDRKSLRCFSEMAINRMFTNPRIVIQDHVYHIYIAIDPCGGSSSNDELKRTSDFCVVSICKPDITIVGLESIPANSPADYQDALVSHIQNFRNNPYQKYATIVCDVETGGGSFDAYNIETHIRSKFDNIIFLKDFDADNGKCGTITSNKSKRIMMEKTRAFMDLDEIKFAKEFSTSHKNEASLLAEFKRQTTVYTRTVNLGKKNAANSIILSGKDFGKDDMCVTLQRVILTQYNFLNDVKYRQHRRV
jgi:hypothetical protein